jgi:hypothetical protein
VEKRSGFLENKKGFWRHLEKKGSFGIQRNDKACDAELALSPMGPFVFFWSKVLE